MRRTAAIVTLLFSASQVQADGWKRPYFGATPPGAWARYEQKSSVGSPSRATVKRLSDDGGKVRIEERTEFTDGSTPVSTMVYVMASGFDVARDLIDYPGWLEAASSAAGTEAPAPVPAEAIATMKTVMNRFGPSATFQATETVDGRSCDRYGYTIATDTTVETGVLWLSDAVPFGLVKKTFSTKDRSGTVLYSGEQRLVASGVGSAGPAPGGKAPKRRFTLQQAYDAGLVAIHVVVDPGVKDGGRLSLVVETAEEAAFELAVPEGTTKLQVGSAVDVIVFHPERAGTFEVNSQHPARFAVAQEGEARVTAGDFTIRVLDGEPSFVGKVTSGWVE